jgi:hypothetical protein
MNSIQRNGSSQRLPLPWLFGTSPITSHRHFHLRTIC